MKAVVVANGDTVDDDATELEGAELVVAADAGARTLERWGRRPEVVVGDLDSLGDAEATTLAGKGVEIRRAPMDKDETDLELAVALALERGADEVVILGAFGGRRLDYDIANALLLVGWPACVRARRGATTVRALRAGETIALASAGARVTLLAATVGTVVGTDGLRWPLRDEALPLGTGRGVSNEVTHAPARVRCVAGAIVVIEDR